MKFAAVVTKLMDRQTEYTRAADAFNAATLGGAKALGQGDLGRIAPGVRADPVIWDIHTLSMAPVRDPIKNIPKRVSSFFVWKNSASCSDLPERPFIGAFAVDARSRDP